MSNPSQLIEEFRHEMRREIFYQLESMRWRSLESKAEHDLNEREWLLETHRVAKTERVGRP